MFQGFERQVFEAERPAGIRWAHTHVGRVMMPTLERWSLVALAGTPAFATPDTPHVALAGWIRGDVRFPDGHEVQTSRVVALDPLGHTALTRRTEYRLGLPHPTFVLWARQQGYGLAAFARPEPLPWSPADDARPFSATG